MHIWPWRKPSSYLHTDSKCERLSYVNIYQNGCASSEIVDTVAYLTLLSVPGEHELTFDNLVSDVASKYAYLHKIMWSCEHYSLRYVNGYRIRDWFRFVVPSPTTFEHFTLASFRSFEGTIISVFIPYIFMTFSEFGRLSFEMCSSQ